MTGYAASHLAVQGPEFGTAALFHPQLGDLVADSAKDGAVGVVVARPGDHPSIATYHLRPPRGGYEWSAPADGSTLRPVPLRATHTTPRPDAGAYDHRAG